jgi:hypothetical protein
MAGQGPTWSTFIRQDEGLPWLERVPAPTPKDREVNILTPQQILEVLDKLRRPLAAPYREPCD